MACPQNSLQLPAPIRHSLPESLQPATASSWDSKGVPAQLTAGPPCGSPTTAKALGPRVLAPRTSLGLRPPNYGSSWPAKAAPLGPDPGAPCGLTLLQLQPYQVCEGAQARLAWDSTGPMPAPASTGLRWPLYSLPPAPNPAPARLPNTPHTIYTKGSANTRPLLQDRDCRFA